MLTDLGATWGELASVVVATVGIYLTLVVLVRAVGQRSLASMSGFDVGCVVALGAVLGRTALLERPTLLVGVVALATFFVMQALLGALRQRPRFDRLVNRRPVLLVRDGRLLADRMRGAHVADDELRLAGVRRLDEVQCAVLERNGSVSVVRRGDDVDPWLLADICEPSETPAPPGGRSGESPRGR